MLRYVLAASVVAAAQARDCTLLTYRQNEQRECGHKEVLADDASISACSAYICTNLIGAYATAMGANVDKVIRGQGEGCQILDWTGNPPIGNLICMKEAAPTPPPTPTPKSCDSLVYSRESCPPGGVIVDLDTLVECREFLCRYRIAPSDYAHGSNKTKLLAGQNYGCELKEWNGTGQDGIICSLSG